MINVNNITNRHQYIYYINEKTNIVYDIANLPIGDKVREYIKNYFPQISYERVEEIEKAYFIRQLAIFNCDFENCKKCNNHFFKYYLDKFKGETGANNEEIKGFLRYFIDNHLDWDAMNYTNELMKKVKDTAEKWYKQMIVSNWYDVIITDFKTIDDFEKYTERLIMYISNHITINYDDANYRQILGIKNNKSLSIA